MRAPQNAIVALASATAVGSAVYGLILRPRISRWGATEEEVRRSLPGDELDSPHGYRPISTRAITTYADGRSATRIHPEWQELHVGNRVPYSRFNYMESGMLLGIKTRVEASSPIPRVSAAAAP